MTASNVGTGNGKVSMVGSRGRPAAEQEQAMGEGTGGGALVGRVAVVTGAASGIGRAISREAARHGMRVVMADIEFEAVQEAAEVLREGGADVLPVRLDVTDQGAWSELARTIESSYEPAWLVVNNAGVSVHARTWELRHSDWQWVLDVNLWGVIHGLETFLPGLVARDEGYVVNTASISGLVVAAQTGGPYAASKHAVVGLSEVLYRELAAVGSAVGVSVLCPGPVVTGIATASRNRQERYGEARPSRRSEYLTPKLEGSTGPDEIARKVFDAISVRRFWVLTHASQFKESIIAWAAQASAEVNPDASSADPLLSSLYQI